LAKKGTKGSFTTGVVEVRTKTLLDSGQVGSGAQGLVQPHLVPGVTDGVSYAPRFANLIPDGDTSSPLVRAFRLSVAFAETTATDSTVTNGIDAIGAAGASLLSISSALPIEPTAVVVGSTDWARLMLLKDEAGHPILGDPADPDFGRTLFGVPVVISAQSAL